MSQVATTWCICYSSTKKCRIYSKTLTKDEDGPEQQPEDVSRMDCTVDSILYMSDSSISSVDRIEYRSESSINIVDSRSRCGHPS